MSSKILRGFSTNSYKSKSAPPPKTILKNELEKAGKKRVGINPTFRQETSLSCIFWGPCQYEKRASLRSTPRGIIQSIAARSAISGAARESRRGRGHHLQIMISRGYLTKLAAAALKKEKALDAIRASLKVKSFDTITGKIISITNSILRR